MVHLSFQDVQLSSESSQPGDWCAALSNYIATSDEAILAATPRLLTFFQDDLLPIVSVDEFADVMGKNCMRVFTSGRLDVFLL